MKTSKRETFFEHYEKIWGPDWPAMLEALKKPEKLAARINAFLPEEEKIKVQQVLIDSGSQKLENFELCFSYSENSSLDEKIIQTELAEEASDLFISPRELQDQYSLWPYYLMDPASIWVASQIPIPQKSDQRVLDMCAAPGGKALILAQKLFLQNSTVNELNSNQAPEKSRLFLNEKSSQRRERLKQVLKQYVPQSIGPSHIEVTGFDATLIGVYQKESYDCILLDAPCSSERHVLKNQKALQEWGPSRLRNLSQQQYSLFCSAFMSLKKGGYLMYSTCALNPEENENIISRVLSKKKDFSFEILPLQHPLAQQRPYGILFEPRLSSWGPMYCVLIQKN